MTRNLHARWWNVIESRRSLKHLGQRSSMKSPELPPLMTMPPGSALYGLRRDPLGFLTNLARTHGDIVRFRLGDHEPDLFLLNHPDYIREVLVTHDRSFTKWFSIERIKEVLGDGLFVSEGEWHMRQRRL